MCQFKNFCHEFLLYLSAFFSVDIIGILIGLVSFLTIYYATNLHLELLKTTICNFHIACENGKVTNGQHFMQFVVSWVQICFETFLSPSPVRYFISLYKHKCHEDGLKLDAQ